MTEVLDNPSSAGDELPKVEISGRLLDKVDTLTSTTMSLLVTLGRVEGQSKAVLVPFVAVNFRGHSGIREGGETVNHLDTILGLENTVFLASDVVDELSSVLRELTTLSTGSAKVASDNLDVVQTMLDSTLESLQGCIDSVRALRT